MRRFVVGLVTLAFRTVYNYKHQKDGQVFSGSSSGQGDQSLELVLANFINCTISLIFEARASGREYTEFFRLLYNIAASGHDASGYLIIKRVIGRLMDFYFDRMSSYNDFFRDMSDVTFKEPDQIDFGESQEEKRKVRNAWEEFMFRKNNKNTIEGYSYKSYLWKTISHLIVYCRVNNTSERSGWQISSFDYQLSPQERVLLMPEAKFVQKVITDVESKISYRSVAKIYSYLSYEFDIFSKAFIEAIKLEMNGNDYTTFKPSFCCILTLLTLNDSLIRISSNDPIEVISLIFSLG